MYSNPAGGTYPNQIRKQPKSHFVLQQCIGQGNFATVYKAVEVQTNKVYAMKIISISKIKSQPKVYELLQTELLILSSIQNDNVIRLYDHFCLNDCHYLVMEFCNGGDLEKYLKTKPNKAIPEKEALGFLKQLLNGFHALHAVKAMHRDFKPANVLIHDGVLKIADLGFCKKATLGLTVLGTGLYMAPEILDNKVYDNKVDIWSLGVSLYEMLFGNVPFDAITEDILRKKIQLNEIDFNYKGIKISKEMQELIKRMLTPDPQKRISWVEIYNHPILNETQQVLGCGGLRGSVLIQMSKEELERQHQDMIFDKNKDFYKDKNNTKFDMHVFEKLIENSKSLPKQNSYSNQENQFQQPMPTVKIMIHQKKKNEENPQNEAKPILKTLTFLPNFTAQKPSPMQNLPEIQKTEDRNEKKNDAAWESQTKYMPPQIPEKNKKGLFDNAPKKISPSLTESSYITDLYSKKKTDPQKNIAPKDLLSKSTLVFPRTSIEGNAKKPPENNAKNKPENKEKKKDENNPKSKSQQDFNASPKNTPPQNKYAPEKTNENNGKIPPKNITDPSPNKTPLRDAKQTEDFSKNREEHKERLWEETPGEEISGGETPGEETPGEDPLPEIQEEFNPNLAERLFHKEITLKDYEFRYLYWRNTIAHHAKVLEEGLRLKIGVKSLYMHFVFAKVIHLMSTEFLENLINKKNFMNLKDYFQEFTSTLMYKMVSSLIKDEMVIYSATLELLREDLIRIGDQNDPLYKKVFEANNLLQAKQIQDLYRETLTDFLFYGLSCVTNLKKEKKASLAKEYAYHMIELCNCFQYAKAFAFDQKDKNGFDFDKHEGLLKKKSLEELERLATQKLEDF